MSDIMELTARVGELETQLAFQDELHSQLNDVVARQDREISELRRQLKDLADRLHEVGNALPGSPTNPTDEVPPHY